MPPGDDPRWCAPVALVPGLNVFRIETQCGEQVALLKTAEIHYVATAPAPPVITTPTVTGTQLVINTTDLEVAGAKAPHTGIFLNDNEVVSTNQDTEFSFVAALARGRDLLWIDARDFCGRTSGNPAVLDVFVP